MRKVLRTAQCAWLLILSCALQQCANMQPPGGGPRDLAPPGIIETDPPSGSVNITPKTITLTFDKYVDKRTVQDALFISPALHGKPKFSWSGKTVEITLPDSLRQNTTYNFAFGTDIADLREHVHLAKPFNFTFSTGPVLDTGRIKGTVYCKEPVGTFVFAYAAATKSLDTLNPAHTKPDYLAAVDKDSTFTMPALPDGVFRLLAVHDEQRNLVYDIGTDGFATTQSDVRIDSMHRTVRRVIFNLAQPEDTIAPTISDVRQLYNNRFFATTSESLDSTTTAPEKFLLIDSATKTAVHIRSVIPSSKKIGVEIFTDSLSPNVTYTMYADSMRDRAGNRMKRDTSRFVAFDKRDTMPPVVTYPFRDSTVDFNDTVLRFTFDKPVKKDAAESAIYLFDSTRKSLPLHFSWFNDVALFAKPDTFMTYAWYTLVTEAQKFTDLYGFHPKDSVIRMRFRTFDERQKGTLGGMIIDTGNSSGSQYVVTITNIKTKAALIYTLPHAGAFTLAHIPDGTYNIDAFRDDKRSRVYFPGKILPWQFAEPYFSYPKSIRVRARWTVEGLNVEF